VSRKYNPRKQQQSKLRKPDMRSALQISQRDVVRCRSGELGYSRLVAEARVKNNPAVKMQECLTCDAWHVVDR
jgi:hypothetical protein